MQPLAAALWAGPISSGPFCFDVSGQIAGHSDSLGTRCLRPPRVSLQF